MRFPQIPMLLVLVCSHLFSCRETLGTKETFPQQEKTSPSKENLREFKPSPKKDQSAPKEPSRDSILKKQQRSKDLDTLKPKVA